MPEAGEAPGAADPGRYYLALLIAVLLIPAALGSSKTIFNDGDVSWHIATGQWILDHRAIPHADPFSYTWAGKPWVAIEWLAELLYASAYRLAGYGGVAALVTAALMALHAMVFFNASRWTRPLLPIVAMDFVLIPTMLARPHLLAWPLVAGWTWLMLRARERDRAPPLIAALLMSLWANLHGSFVFGFAIAGAFGVEALVASADKAKALQQWLIFGAACAAAVFVNANGVEGVFHPLRFAGLKMLPLIDEWRPSSPTVTPVFFAVLALTLGLILWKRPRLHPVRWVLLGAFLIAALLQMRHQAMLGIMAAMILPEGFARKPAGAEAGTARISSAIVAAGAALLIIVRAALPLSPPDNDANPWKLIAAVPPQLRSQPVLNGYSMGGPLILSGIRPYVDGRGDMYGDDLVVGYADIVHGDARAFDEAVRRWNIHWAILPNGSRALIAVLDRAGWQRIASDGVGVVYVRPTSA
ncbi:MAG: hypothetical protein QOF34_1337 [Sphingomonadales bacterium]|nr:hypothetical protein [Sphingomonadales bacterium]